jgi:hypothetical protein
MVLAAGLHAEGYVMPAGGVRFPVALRELTGPGGKTAPSMSIEWDGVYLSGVR